MLLEDYVDNGINVTALEGDNLSEMLRHMADLLETDLKNYNLDSIIVEVPNLYESDHCSAKIYYT